MGSNEILFLYIYGNLRDLIEVELFNYRKAKIDRNFLLLEPLDFNSFLCFLFYHRNV